jgi:hypothetical protein
VPNLGAPRARSAASASAEPSHTGPPAPQAVGDLLSAAADGQHLHGESVVLAVPTARRPLGSVQSLPSCREWGKP